MKAELRRGAAGGRVAVSLHPGTEYAAGSVLGSGLDAVVERGHPGKDVGLEGYVFGADRHRRLGQTVGAAKDLNELADATGDNLLRAGGRRKAVLRRKALENNREQLPRVVERDPGQWCAQACFSLNS